MRLRSHYLLIVSVIFFSFNGGCNGSGNKRDSGADHPSRSSAAPSGTVPLSGRIINPSPGELFTRGENVSIELSINENGASLSSYVLTVDGVETEFSGNIPGKLVWDSSDAPVGRRNLMVSLMFDDHKREAHPLEIVLKSDIVPERFTYRIIKEYPHDIRAFTQGLVYEDGYLYESTGEYGRSTLRKVELETGEVIRSLNLPRELWGEGLCIHDGRLYQLTWKSNVGFVYDKNTFRELGRFYYQTEGWGLTGDGVNLYKTDGSHHVYVIDPAHFSEKYRIEVFDNNGKVDNLNELEMIDGLIYANVFTTDEIVMIEPETGRVTGRIDLTGLLDRKYHHRNLDVLNGIAYDKENDRLFVTGKNWPRLFEIQPVPGR
jgi:glutaminyl-peptide cyclotransferase